MSSDSPRRARLAWLVLASLVTVGCEAVLGLGPEPDPDRASSSSSATASPSAASTSASTGGTGGDDASTSSSSAGGDGGGAAATTTGGGGSGSGSAYADAVLADGPLVYLRLGDDAGPAAEAALGPDGTYVDEHLLVLGQQGAIAGDADAAVRFAGGAIDLGDVHDPSGFRPFTFEAWVMPLAADSETYQRIFSKEPAAAGREGVDLWLNQGYLTFERWENDDYLAALAGPLPEGTWAYVVGTFDGTAMNLYVDGELATTQVLGSPVSVVPSDISLTIGRTPYGGQALSAVLDEVAVYDFALSPGRIRVHFDVGIGAQ